MSLTINSLFRWCPTFYIVYIFVFSSIKIISCFNYFMKVGGKKNFPVHKRMSTHDCKMRPPEEKNYFLNVLKLARSPSYKFYPKTWFDKWGERWKQLLPYVPPLFWFKTNKSSFPWRCSLALECECVDFSLMGLLFGFYFILIRTENRFHTVLRNSICILWTRIFHELKD